MPSIAALNDWYPIDASVSLTSTEFPIPSPSASVCSNLSWKNIDLGGSRYLIGCCYVVPNIRVAITVISTDVCRVIWECVFRIRNTIIVGVVQALLTVEYDSDVCDLAHPLQYTEADCHPARLLFHSPKRQTCSQSFLSRCTEGPTIQAQITV